ncbi:Kelch repeat-containing protein [Fulvia fulva]|nr:Kelch repeat-containing protein [Fulvia fulva]KAK4614503.1 Kelch repeat-containing protein [Fulvia fulva]WPV20649.1 Kelch repeat-containing protein [Fulvia fulva]WPV35475.1 Kelch repeat-containing protein [Fulvia fulva]
MGTSARKSFFQEVDVDDLEPETSLSRSSSTASESSSSRKRPSPGVRFRTKDDVRLVERYETADVGGNNHELSAKPIPSTNAPTQSPLPGSKSIMYRLGAKALLVVAAVPFLHGAPSFGHASLPLQPVSGGPIRRNPDGPVLDKRADSPTDVCFRWAGQSAVVNGTLYYYGGQATSEPNQDTNTWNNNFLSLDLTKTWQISTPSLTGLPQPSGPPNISLGTLWNSHDSLFLYGGQFQWKPPVSPTAYSTWEYNIASSSWVEHSDPVTSEGVSSPSNDDPVQRAAEGAAVNVASLGRGFYFGGHLDGYTTEEWSQSIARVYLQSLLEFTFPGYQNDQVNALSDNKDAGSDGVYRNVTQGGLQSQAGFTQRADGLLVYVPGFGEQGILLALAGGTNESFTQMNQINVYDIANSTWYNQATSGEYPETRVNPCSVIAAAPDGSSYNIYMFGGQNLIPAGNQTQYNDMWILTLPSFTWIKVDQSGQSVPPGRSGHTCNIWDGQMVMVGGYTGANSLTCESPGIYVYDLSTTSWVNQFTATSAESDSGSTSGRAQADTNGDAEDNPFNQQSAQRYTSDNPGGLEGSYGYLVPQAVIDVVGGDKTGGATLTTPVNTATSGPLATGKPLTYTVTNADGSISTSTSRPGSGSGSSGNGVNVGAIVAGCVAGFFFIVACYLAFCAYVYRKQLQLYKRHVEMSQAQARGEKLPAIPGLLATDASTGKITPSDPSYRRGDGVSPWLTNTSSGSMHSRDDSGGASGSYHRNGGNGVVGGGYNSVRRSSETSETNDEDLLNGREPTFVGVMLNPRRSLRVINRD